MRVALLLAAVVLLAVGAGLIRSREMEAGARTFGAVLCWGAAAVIAAAALHLLPA